jgi:thiol-disulfide isomerase/thioredoxin
MNRRHMIVGAGVLLFTGSARADTLLPLRSGQWAGIRQSLAGQPAIVHLWGLTCAPCIEELPRWSAFVAARPRAQVLFVQFDPMPETRVLATLRKAGLSGARHYTVQGFADERLRYEFDPDWGGELPRTLLIGTDRTARGHSGSVDFAQIRRWVDGQRGGVARPRG